MMLKNNGREPLEELLIMLKIVREDCFTAFYREQRFFRELEARGFFEILEANGISRYVDVFNKMKVENENQLQRIENLLKVINDEMKRPEADEEVGTINRYFSCTE